MSHNEFDQTAIAGLYACRDCGAIVADEEAMERHHDDGLVYDGTPRFHPDDKET